jgi:hypothetical protein
MEDFGLLWSDSGIFIFQGLQRMLVNKTIHAPVIQLMSVRQNMLLPFFFYQHPSHCS